MHAELLHWTKRKKVVLFELLSGKAECIYRILSAKVKVCFDEASEALSSRSNLV